MVQENKVLEFTNTLLRNLKNKRENAEVFLLTLADFNIQLFVFDPQKQFNPLPFAHGLQKDVLLAHAQYTVYIVDRNAVSELIPEKCWSSADVLNDSTIDGFANCAIYTSLEAEYGNFFLVDHKSKTAVKIFNLEPDAIADWEYCYPLRKILNQFTKGTPFALVHAGGLVNISSQNGIALTGKGQSGKSTISAIAVSKTIGYSGDDFLLINPDNGMAYCLYSSLKVREHLDHKFENHPVFEQYEINYGQGKSNYYIPIHRSGYVSKQFKIRAIVKPHYQPETGKNEFQQVSKSQMMQYMSVSTLVIMRGGEELDKESIGLLLFQFIAKLLPINSRAFIIADNIKEAKVNDIDRERVDLGYYDQMTDVGGISRTGTQFLLLGDAEWGKASGATHITGDIMLREFTPNARVVHHGYHLNINHMGLRDQEYTDLKPAQTLRFAFCGGSYVLGPGMEKEETFEALVEKQLNDSLKKVGGGNLEILNFANGGYLLPQVVKLCETKVFKYSPDYVFYFAHPGELTYTPKNISRLLSFGVDISAFPEVKRIVDKLNIKQSTSRLEMTTKMAPYQEQLLRWGYKRIVDQCKANKAIPVWVFLPTTTDGDTDAEFLKISKIAREYNFIVLNLSNIYASKPASLIQNSESDSHPNALGNKLIAIKLEDEIRKNILLPHVSIIKAGTHSTP